MKQLFLSALFLLAGMGCSEDKKYDAISTTRVRPPVQESLPPSLLSGGSYGLTPAFADVAKTCADASEGDVCLSAPIEQRLLCRIKNRLFCKGPTELLTLLDSVDIRLKEVEERSTNGDVACVTATPVDLSSQLTFPGDQHLTSKFQCQDTSNGFAFGEEDKTWYLREAGAVGGRSFKISPEGEVDGFIWLASADGSLSMSTGFLQIHASQADKTMELTGGGVGFGFCGMHLKASSTHIYIDMNADGVGKSCDSNNSGTTEFSDWDYACLDATTLDPAPISDCAGIQTFSFATIGRAATTPTGSTETWEAVAPWDGHLVVDVELNTFLNELNKKAADYPGVAEFSPKK